MNKGIAKTLNIDTPLVPLSGRCSLEDRKVWRYDRPDGTVADEDRDGWTERRWVVQGARIDSELIAFADLATEDQTAANETEIAHSLSTACRFRFVYSSLTAN